MDLTTQVHLAAGLAALGLAIAALARSHARSSARLFAAFCLSLATWNLAAAAWRHGAEPAWFWRVLAHAGGCLSAPLGLHLALTFGRRVREEGRLLLGAYGAVIGALVLAFLLVPSNAPLRALVLGVPVALVAGRAAVELRRHLLSLGPSPERSSLRLLTILALVATACGLSDLIPRGDSGVPRVGPLALVPFLAALAALGLRRRYVDLDQIVARVLALALAAAAASALLQAAVALAGPSALTFFLASLLIIAATVPLFGAILAGARALLDPGTGETARALVAASQEMSRAEDAEGALRVMQQLAGRLPGGAKLHLLLGAEAPDPASALMRLLAEDQGPVTCRLLEIDAREATAPARRELAAQALTEMRGLGFEIAAPLSQERGRSGVVALGGGEPERYVGGEAGASLVALGHQALATLARIEADDRARRREALAVVGEMAASLAHDVRNPLGAIRGAAQVLAEAKDPAQEREMLQVIDSESERLGRVLGEFLEWARPAQPRRARVDLSEIAKRAALQARLMGGAVEVDVPGRPVTALGDPELLARAAGNLVRNACEAAGPAGRVVVRAGPAGAGRVSLRVEDDGPGLAPAVRARLFEPFVTTKSGGTGLGLALVQRAATAHGGDVTAEDLEPRGTAFTLVLPAAGHDAGGDGP